MIVLSIQWMTKFCILICVSVCHCQYEHQIMRQNVPQSASSNWLPMDEVSENSNLVSALAEVM
jgi:hypothetical protein